MNEIEFRIYLTEKGMKSKVVSDTISRLKRIEKELSPCDMDNEYRKDRCEWLMKAFLNMGVNDEMKPFTDKVRLPIGKYYMSTYRHAIKQYIEFCDSINS